MTPPTAPAITIPPPHGLDDIAAAVTDAYGELRAWLDSLVAIPSVSAQPEHADDVRESAAATARLLEECGFEGVELLETGAAAPYVTGEWLHRPGAPTVLFYAHHDVQPVSSPDKWSSAPFVATEREGRLYGRGAADDKAGIVAHAAALRAWIDARGGPLLNVKVIVEGEEEIGSPHLEAFLAEHGDRLAADVVVLTDLSNWKVGWPGITRSLRGMASVTVTLGALEQPIHSGMWGGPVPDALTGMIRLLSTLHDEHGNVAVAGFDDDVQELTDEDHQRLLELGEDPDEIRADTRMLDGVRFVGDPDAGLLERMWLRPAITPIGIDAPRVAESSNTLLARVRARLSCRFAPGQDPDRALDALADHLRAHAPWGLHVEVDAGERNAAWQTPAEGPAWDAAVAAMTAAYGRTPAVLGCGGSIPFVEPVSAALNGAPCLLVGVEDPASNAHGDDESLHLGDFLRTCLTEAYLLDELARRLPR